MVDGCECIFVEFDEQILGRMRKSGFLVGQNGNRGTTQVGGREVFKLEWILN
ncbi:unnamed protein product [Lupinus luteus]|uniref:Uncharacterized protein n=1 Tax=Lupinus luteus TaxID=3873 RepID=A0AAV1Y8M0_LUPLU